MASLTLIAGKGAGTRYTLADGSFILGRDPACSAQLDDPIVSRQHLRVRCDLATKTYFASDIGSRNGSSINDLPLVGEHRLTDGDILGLGQTLLRFNEDKSRPVTQDSFSDRDLGQSFRETMA